MNFSVQLSVIILNYNVRYFLELCLQSVVAATQDIASEILVVDNNSSDASMEMVQQQFPNVITIENHENLGFSKAYNRAVSKAKGEYVCILNPDTVVAEETFKQLLNFMKSKKKVGIVGCKLVDGCGKFLPESKRNIPKITVALQKIIGINRSYYVTNVAAKQVAKVPILVGAFMLLSKKKYEALNGFDQDYFMYGEDIDLSYKSILEGYDNYYYGKTTVIHYKGESTLKDATYAKRFFNAMQIFYKKHFKRNIFFDYFVIFGIKLASRFRPKNAIVNKPPKTNIYLSKSKKEDIPFKFPFTVQYSSKLIDPQPNTQYIFDAASFSFSKIIATMEKYANVEQIQFKIHPKKTNYLIGSNSSKNRGEIITLQKK